MALLLGFLIYLPADAATVNADGYTTNGDGLYWYGGQAYVKKYWKNYYTAYASYSYGCSACTYPYQTYYLSSTYEPVTMPAAGNYEDRRKFLLSLASSRQKIENALRTKALEHQQEMEFARSLGLYFPSESFGRNPMLPTIPNYAGYSGANQVGSVGGTAYGSYTFNTSTDVYGRLDPNVALQQASMLTKNAQDLGGTAFGQLIGWVDADGTRQAALADRILSGQAVAGRTLARGTAAATALNAAQSVEQHTQTTITGVGIKPAPVQANPMPPADPQLPGPPQQQAAAALSCAKCHGSGEHGFDFSKWDYAKAKPAQRWQVSRYIDPEAPADKRCPKGGPPLSGAQRKLLGFK
jgi:hypothetical protein